MVKHPPSGDQESLVCLEMLRDAQTPEIGRVDVFTRMLKLDHGWWGAGTLPKFAAGVALGFTRRKLQPFGVPPDRLDWEGIADDALMLLFRDAHQISGSPRNWLIGTIKNLVKQEIRRTWSELTMESLPETLQLLEHEEISEKEQHSLALDDAIVDGIRDLTPALRVIAELLYIHQLPRDEVAAYLEISDATLRKRVQRVKKLLLGKLQTRAGLSPPANASEEAKTKTFRQLHRVFGKSKGA